MRYEAEKANQHVEVGTRIQKVIRKAKEKWISIQYRNLPEQNKRNTARQSAKDLIQRNRVSPATLQDRTGKYLKNNKREDEQIIA